MQKSSPKKIASRGPSVHAHFVIKDEHIENIALKLSSQGLSWVIEGTCSSSLEKKIDQWMNDYAAGKKSKVGLPIILKVPPYTMEVLAALQDIPFGESSSYQAIAKKTGNPKAARAVGNSCGRNPLLLIIPCHRVLANDGGLGGFSNDIEIKRRLLSFENIDY